MIAELPGLLRRTLTPYVKGGNTEVQWFPPTDQRVRRVAGGDHDLVFITPLERRKGQSRLLLILCWNPLRVLGVTWHQ